MLLRSISLIALAAVLALGAPPAAPRPRRRARCSSARSTRPPPATGRRPRRSPGETGSQVADDLVLWPRLRDGAGDWDEYAALPRAASRLARRWRRCAAPAERQMPSGQPPEAVFAFFAGEPPQTGTGVAAPRRGAGDRRPRGRGRGRDRPRLARLLDDRPPSGKALLGRWKAALAAAPRGAARHAALARPDRRGRGDAAAGRRRLAGARPGPHRGAPRRRGAAVRDQPGAGGAAATTPASPTSATSTASSKAPLAGGRGLPAREVDARPRRSAGRSCGWSAGPTSRGRRSRTARSRRPTRIAAQNFGSGGADYADAEWVAGFIALTRMDDPETAVEHFRALPGRGRDADQPRPRRLLARPRLRGGRRRRGGARPPSATARATRRASTASSPPSEVGLARRPARSPAAGAPPDWQQRAVHALLAWSQAAYFLHLAGDDGARRDLLPPRRRRPAGRRSGRRWRRWRSTSAGPQIGLRIAKDAAADGIILADQYYPLHADRRARLAGADRVRDGDRPPGVRARRRGGERRRRPRADAADAGDGPATWPRRPASPTSRRG